MPVKNAQDLSEVWNKLVEMFSFTSPGTCTRSSVLSSASALVQ